MTRGYPGSGKSVAAEAWVSEEVCRMWHRIGVPLFRVGDPDSNF